MSARGVATSARRSFRTETSIAIDPTRCDAFGYCAELVPELIGVDEWGYPVLRSGEVPPWLAERAREAARQCPRRAVHVLDVRRVS